MNKSSDIEARERSRLGEKARIIPAPVREALAVLEGEIESKDSRYHETLHTEVIAKLVQHGNPYTAAPSKSAPAKPEKDRLKWILLLGVILLVSERGFEYWPLLASHL